MPTIGTWHPLCSRVWHERVYRSPRARFQFAVDVVAFSRDVVSRDVVLRRIALQLVDAAGSVGANLEEAAAAQTKRDFISKNSIA
ncbi:MAG TPA: four helix bundle protein, partial [Vicinamibacterales bacterium]|nr:four helix bundle protein [Vicinamibacterales bacterium]